MGRKTDLTEEKKQKFAALSLVGASLGALFGTVGRVRSVVQS